MAEVESMEPEAEGFQVWIVWGDEASRHVDPHLCHYVYDSQAELNAFLEGVEAASGYLDHEQFDSLSEFHEWVAEQNGVEPEIVCISDHLVDCGEEDEERYIDVGDSATLLLREERADGVHYFVGVPGTGAQGWYDEADFRAKFKFVE